MPKSFPERKREILSQLAVPDQDYTDLSPKGTVDAGIRSLVDDINRLDGLVTTSSCAGRVSIFLEGVRKTASSDEADADGNNGVASIGGKGGGKWLFVSHDPVDLPTSTAGRSIFERLGIQVSQHLDNEAAKLVTSNHHRRFVHLKFEPMVGPLHDVAHIRTLCRSMNIDLVTSPILTFIPVISRYAEHMHQKSSTRSDNRWQILHILSSSLAKAQSTLAAGMTAGFRESGISGITGESPTPLVAIRTAGLAFDCIIGRAEDDGELVPMVSEGYIETMIDVANERFVVNAERTARFQQALLQQESAMSSSTGHHAHPDWEPADVRRERKRAEGLRRREEMQQQRERAESTSAEQSDQADPGIDAVESLTL